MSDQTIFGTENNTTDTTDPKQNTTANQQNALVDLLAQIKNEAGAQKYSSVEEALRGAANAQEHIRTILQEKKELEERLNAVAQEKNKNLELEKTVYELIQKQKQLSDHDNKAVTPEEIAALVNRTIQTNEVNKTAKQNTDSVISAMVAEFGADAEKKFVQAALDAGLSVEDMNSLAAKSPKAVLKMVGLDGKQKQQNYSPSTSAINTAGFKPSKDTFVRRNSEQTQVGATTQELQEESKRAKQMVEELHAAGMTTHELADPKVYFKYFGK